MKKTTIAAIMAITVLTLGACGKAPATQAPTQAPVATEAPQATSTPVPTEAPKQFADCKELLDKIYDAHSDDFRYPVAGGSEDNISYEGPAIFTLGTGEALDAMTGFPVAEIAKIDQAATAMHAMNANTFTAGAYHLTNVSDASALAKAIASNIQNRMWVCGCPERLIVIQVDDVLISAFGFQDIVEYFRDTTSSTFQNVTVLVEENIQ